MKVSIPEIGLTLEIDVATWIEKFGLPSPPSSLKLEVDEAADTTQTALEDFSQSEDFDERTISKGRDHNHKRRKFIYRCSICGLVGYNARSHPNHFSE
jgi:hypothetical protein